MKDRKIVPLEDRTARLTVLIDPRKKEVFERVCAAEDVTPSQVVRRLIREYIEARTGQSWSASGAAESPRAPPSPDRRPPRR